jgi:hypothetical protein
MLITTSNRDFPDSSRRIFVAGAFAALAVVCLSRFRLWKTAESDLHALAKRLVGLLGLANYPVSNTAAPDVLPMTALVEKLFGDNPARAASMSDAELREHLHRRVVLDYEIGRVQSVQGWLVSTTESDALTLAHRLSVAVRHR